jgi:hypothetical protein
MCARRVHFLCRQHAAYQFQKHKFSFPEWNRATGVMLGSEAASSTDLSHPGVSKPLVGLFSLILTSFKSKVGLII